MKANKIRRLLADYGQKIARRHLVMGAMGNISARDAKMVWIKRGGAWLEMAKAGHFIAVDVKTGRARRGHLPSKEVFLHLGCYWARPDVGAVVHTHPAMTTALATVGISLTRSTPALVKRLGSPVVILPYYAPGSPKLAQEVRRAIKKVNAVMLANHGLVTVGKDIQQAYQRTLVCEQAAKKILSDLRDKRGQAPF